MKPDDGKMAGMGFRRSKRDAQEAREWKQFVAAERDAFAQAGLPISVYDRSVFVYFLEHSYVDDGSGVTIERLQPEQLDVLAGLVARYYEAFGDADVWGLMAFLRARGYAHDIAPTG